MTKLRRLSLLDLPTAAQVGLVAGACDTTPVRGLTHGFYKYPARFSPSFVRAAIETFTQPADVWFAGNGWHLKVIPPDFAPVV
jgi:hypothetical protein